MTNHVHLLLTPARKDSASLLTKHLGQRYVQYVNRRYRRSGTLWEGRFRSCLVQRDEYVLTCYRYIELNPVRAGMVAHPRDYRWSVNGGKWGQTGFIQRKSSLTLFFLTGWQDTGRTGDGGRAAGLHQGNGRMGRGCADSAHTRGRQAHGDLMPVLKDAWRTGDDDALESIAMKPSKDKFLELYESLLVRRNKAWIPDMERLLATPEVELVLVGAYYTWSVRTASWRCSQNAAAR